LGFAITGLPAAFIYEFDASLISLIATGALMNPPLAACDALIGVDGCESIPALMKFIPYPPAPFVISPVVPSQLLHAI
jgi:hypothetical protein